MGGTGAFEPECRGVLRQVAVDGGTDGRVGEPHLAVAPGEIGSLIDLAGGVQRGRVRQREQLLPLDLHRGHGDHHEDEPQHHHGQPKGEDHDLAGFGVPGAHAEAVHQASRNRSTTTTALPWIGTTAPTVRATPVEMSGRVTSVDTVTWMRDPGVRQGSASQSTARSGGASVSRPKSSKAIRVARVAASNAESRPAPVARMRPASRAAPSAAKAAPWIRKNVRILSLIHISEPT